MTKTEKKGVGAHREYSRIPLREIAASIIELLLPRRCAGCGELLEPGGSNWFCKQCLGQIPWITSPMCPRCGCPFPNSAGMADYVCGNCAVSAPPYESARSAVVFTGLVRDRIHQLKFGSQLHWAPPLGQLLARVFEREYEETPDILIPVPLHLKRLKERGFNQSALLAKELGGKFEIPVDFDSLERGIRTKPQTRLNRRERLQNVKNAFRIADAAAIEGKRVCLVDDVLTTGTTIEECAKVLAASGAREVRVITVARALPGRIEIDDPPG